MKKVISKISVYITAFLLMLFSFGFIGNIVNNTAFAMFEDTYTSGTSFEDNAMYLTYADEALIGIDSNGYVWRSNDGSLNMQKNNTQLPMNILSTLGSTADYGSQQYLQYHNGVLVYTTFTDSNTVVYYSTDKGNNWSSVIIGTTASVGYPVTLIYGNGFFALMTARDNEIGNIYTSQDGITWTKKISDVKADFNFSYSNGYFFRTEYPTAAEAYAGNTTIKIYYSVDFINWNNFNAPGALVANSLDSANVSNPIISPMFYNNTFYVVGSFYDTANNHPTYMYSSTTLDSWREITGTNNIAGAFKVVTYQNGFIACTYSSMKMQYIELYGDNQILCRYYPDNWGVVFSYDYENYSAMYPNTVIESQNNLVIGYSGHYGQVVAKSGNDNNQYEVAAFKLYSKAVKHTVIFQDWNGNVITSTEVADGYTAIVPTSPTRDGYTFTGWDKDTSQKITKDTVFTAQYEINKHTVMFLDYNGQEIKTLSVEYGTTLSESDIPVPQRDGYQFTGWSLDTTQAITANTTFVAQYSEVATLTIKYQQPSANFGLLNQFIKTQSTEYTITYDIGETLKNAEYIEFYNSKLKPWIEDYSVDGDYDYDVLFTGWDVAIPETVTKDLTITATFEKLNNVRLEYFSQLRFYTQDSYYICFVGNMKIERLVKTGEVIKLDDFKRADVNYEDYNASRGAFYNNLYNFEFLGWDRDVSVPISEDVIIKGQYNMPTINVRMFDADNYLFNEEEQTISFLSVSDLVGMQSSKDKWDYFVEVLRNFFLFRWDEVAEIAHEKYDFAQYIQTVANYNSNSTQILTPFVVIDTNNPDIYGGIFQNGSVNEDSAILKYYKGNAYDNDLTYWINPIVFANDLYPLTCTVTYGTVLDSALKEVYNIYNFIMDILEDLWAIIRDWWWVIGLIVLAIIFRKELKAFLILVIGWIKSFFKWIGSLFKKWSNKKQKSDKEYKKTKKQIKKKE